MRHLTPLVLLVLSGNALAQSGREVTSDDLSGIVQSDRELLHPGNPLQIIGIEQGDNNFRAATPTLGSGEIVATLVDFNTLRDRRLAMYKDRARFDTHVPGTRMTTTEPIITMPPFQADLRKVALPDPPGSNYPYGKIAFFGGLIVGVMFLLSRLRFAPSKNYRKPVITHSKKSTKLLKAQQEAAEAATPEPKKKR